MLLDVQSLEAGRELDTLVAEKVFGYKLEFGQTDFLGLDTFWGGGDKKYIRHDDDSPESIPPYSKSIAAAWEVVERMNERGAILILDQDWSQRWSASFAVPLKKDDPRRGDGITGSWMYEADDVRSPALAICRAALKVMEAEP